MRRLWVLLPLVILLGGCGTEETFETIADDLAQPVMAQRRAIAVELPEDAVAPVLESGQEQVYLCADYEIMMETLSAGDVGATVRHISGYDRENLTVLKTRQDDAVRYDFVWVSAGEEGDRLGRAVILDDGQYHYCMSVLRNAEPETSSQIVWSQVFSSFRLA